MSVIDEKGFRSNVGIILINNKRRLFWGRRCGQNAWQFPQGGLLPSETTIEAMYRELKEEVGLDESHVELIAESKHWLKYCLPPQFIRRQSTPLCIGQKQKWFLLKVIGPDENICLNRTDSPEFDKWRWVSYWYPVSHVIDFKRSVYRRALREFVPKVFGRSEIIG